MTRNYFKLLLCICAFLTGCEENELYVENTPSEDAAFLIRDILQQVQDEYADDVDMEKLVHGALSGALASLDPHSTYLPPLEYKLLMDATRGEFGGIGVEIAFQTNGLFVVTPIDNMPAQKAGLQHGDIITHINGQDVEAMTQRDAIHKLHGDVGSIVKLTIKRPNMDSFDIHVKRDTIPDNPLKISTFDDIIYLHLPFFNEKSGKNIRSALKKAQKDNKSLKGIILDLRYNPGGTLEQAVDVSRIFIETGVIVDVKSRNDQFSQTFKANKKSILKRVPLVVMVNGFSASGAEVVAGAVKDHKRGAVLGQKTFGKGSVQEVFPIPGNGGIKLTVAKFYTPHGHAIQGEGVTPTIIVDSKVEGFQLSDPETDHQLKRAIDFLKNIASLEKQK